MLAERLMTRESGDPVYIAKSEDGKRVYVRIPIDWAKQSNWLSLSDTALIGQALKAIAEGEGGESINPHNWTASQHLRWIHDRLVEHYGESRNLSHMHRLREIIADVESEERRLAVPSRSVPLVNQRDST